MNILNRRREFKFELFLGGGVPLNFNLGERRGPPISMWGRRVPA